MICNFYGWVFDRFGDSDNCRHFSYQTMHAEYGISHVEFAHEYPEQMVQDASDLIKKQSDEVARSWKNLYLKELREHIASCQEQAADIEKELSNS